MTLAQGCVTTLSKNLKIPGLKGTRKHLEASNRRGIQLEESL